MKLCAEIWRESKSHRCLSISLSLLASSSFTFSRILLIQGGLCCSRLAYLSQESTQIFSQDIPSVFQTPTNMKAFFLLTPRFVWRYTNLHSVPLSYNCHTFTLTDNHPNCTALYMVVHIWLWVQHLFNTLHIRDWVKIHLSAAQLMYLKLRGGGSLDTF